MVVTLPVKLGCCKCRNSPSGCLACNEAKYRRWLRSKGKKRKFKKLAEAYKNFFKRRRCTLHGKTKRKACLTKNKKKGSLAKPLPSASQHKPHAHGKGTANYVVTTKVAKSDKAPKLGCGKCRSAPDGCLSCSHTKYVAYSKRRPPKVQKDKWAAHWKQRRSSPPRKVKQTHLKHPAPSPHPKARKSIGFSDVTCLKHQITNMLSIDQQLRRLF